MPSICWRRRKNWLCGIWTVEDNCPWYNVLPDLALSSSFISYTLHRPLPPLHAQCQSPPPICQTFQWAPSVSCQSLGTGWIPCKNPQGQWLYYPALHVLKNQPMMWPSGSTGHWQSSWSAKVAAEDTGWALLSSLGAPPLAQCSPTFGSEPIHLHRSVDSPDWVHASFGDVPQLHASLCCNRATPDLHSGAEERKKKKENRGSYTTPLAPLLSCHGGLFLWSWFLLFF